ncbi:class I SAM-dependent methyltransferase [Coraliomargarita akajimensis]|nr:class I SAM-dependent methyltransferase [Coraliomargarita akajimensis]
MRFAVGLGSRMLAFVERVLEPELLDQLNPQDRAAQRSRRDLLLINQLMRTDAWLLGQLRRIVSSVDTVIELGAGEGHLLGKVSECFPQLRCVGYDLVPRPDNLDESIEWVSGDFMMSLDSMPIGERTVVLANLIVHHFDEGALERMRAAFEGVGALLLVEPDRSRASIWLGRLLLPFVGPVTRADMLISIRAGFARGELEARFRKRCITESCWLGGRRLVLK